MKILIAAIALVLSSAGVSYADESASDKFVRAIVTLRPHAQFSFTGPDCTKVVWSDPTTQAPTCNEINAAIAALGPPVPESVSLSQLQIALSRAGKLSAAQTWIANQPTEIKLGWAGGTIARSSPTIAAAQAALGYTSAQVDQLFITAGAINP